MQPFYRALCVSHHIIECASLLRHRKQPERWDHCKRPARTSTQHE